MVRSAARRLGNFPLALYASLLTLVCLLPLGCSRFIYSIQTDGAHTHLPEGAQARLAVWGTTSSVVGAATTWLQKRGMLVIERSRLQQIVNEQRLRLLQTRDQEADLLKIGQLAGATVLVFADGTVTVGRDGNASVSIRAVDVASAVVLWSGHAQYTGTLAYVDYALAGLTCEALATAWGYRAPGSHLMLSSSHCETPQTAGAEPSIRSVRP